MGFFPIEVIMSTLWIINIKLSELFYVFTVLLLILLQWFCDLLTNRILYIEKGKLYTPHLPDKIFKVKCYNAQLVKSTWSRGI